MQGYNDSPIHALKDDLFGVQSYVNGLCKFIMECETPMTVSIQGDWGSGKTSMMNMIQSELGDKIFPIWFNTWQFSQFQPGNSLAISMLEVLLHKLNGDTKALNEIAFRMFDVAKLIPLAALEVHFGAMMKDKLENFIDSFFKQSYIEEITELKDKFQKAINAKINAPIKRVVVFVDDLDRLEPARAVELLEVLKLFIDCENCVFVLAVDYEVVTLGIRQKYGTDINKAKGKSFFDKIIQLPFKMPVAQYGIEKYINSMMDKMHVKDKATANVNLFSSLIKTSVGLNPRAMKRLFNAYQLLYNVMPDEIKFNNFKQRILFAAVCMQMSFEEVYNYLLAGNTDVTTLTGLAAVDDNAVIKFIHGDDSEENILASMFNPLTLTEEQRETLQKFPTFVKYFIAAVKTKADAELSDKEVDYLRGILKNSAITAVQLDNQTEADKRAISRREKNRERAQNINKLLAKMNIGEFTLLQDMRSNNKFVSTSAMGYRIYTRKTDGKKYQLRYVLDYTTETELALSIYLNGCDRDKDEFYAEMGKDPLDYKKPPKRHSTQGWYYYDNIIRKNDNDADLEQSVANEVKAAYERLKQKLDDTLE